MIVSFVATGYRESLPSFESLDTLSYFGWTAGHRPIAGATDWASVGILAAATAALLVLGALLFFKYRHFPVRSKHPRAWAAAWWSLPIALPLDLLQVLQEGPSSAFRKARHCAVQVERLRTNTNRLRLVPGQLLAQRDHRELVGKLDPLIYADDFSQVKPPCGALRPPDAARAAEGRSPRRTRR